ncbi:MAG TPA: hypothetical protein VGJ94_07590 [Syntrophorhabdaceae bacterium]
MEEIKKPDFLMVAVQSAITYVRTHLKLVIIAAAVCCIAGLSVFAYAAYEDRKSAKAQSAIMEGVKSLESYNQAGKKEDLDKAETIFQKVVKEKPGKIYMVAELYLGTVYALKGRADDAKNIYRRLARKGPTVVRMLAEKALLNLDTK